MRRRFPLVLTLAIVCLVFWIDTYGLPTPQSVPAGVVVEEVTPNGAAAKAGITTGDVLSSWSRAAGPPANSQEAQGFFAVPFDVTEIEIEQAPRGEVTLSGRRDGGDLSFVLDPAAWGIRVRPHMSEDVLSSYSTGKAFVDAKDTDKAVRAWREAAAQAKRENDSRVALWLLFRSGEALRDAKKWLDAETVYNEMIVEAERAGESRESAAAWEGLGATFRSQNNLPKAADAYREALKVLERVSPETLLVAMTVNVLGTVALDRGDLTTADELFSRVLMIRERLAPTSLAVAAVLNNSAIVARRREDLTRAEDLIKKAQAIQERVSPGSLDVAVSLTNLGLVAVSRGNLVAAEDFYKRSLLIYDTLKPESLEKAGVLINLGTAKMNRGDLSGGEDSNKSALTILEKLAPGSIDVGRVLGNLGNAALTRGNLEMADGYYRRALAIYEIVAPDTIVISDTLSNYGVLERSRGNLAAAEEYTRRALAIREKLAPNSSSVSASLSNLGLLAWDRGDLDAADAYHRRALAIKEPLAPGSLDVANSLINLGVVAADRGDLAVAENYYKNALQIRQKLAPDSLLVASALNNIGNISRSRGDVAAAEEYHRRALVIREKLAPNSLDIARTFANLGIVARIRGDLASAEDYLRKALEIRQKLAPDGLEMASVLAELGVVAMDQGDLAAAENHYQRNLAITEKLAPGSVGMAQTLDNLATVALKRGDAQTAEKLNSQALTALERLGPEGLDVAHTLESLGLVAEAKGDLASSERFHLRSLAIREKLAPRSADEAGSLYKLGVIRRGMGDQTMAADYFRRAIDSIESQFTRIGGAQEVRSGFAARYMDYYRDYVQLLLEQGRTAEAFQVLERSRARNLLTMMAERDLVLSSDVSPEIERELKLVDAEYDRTQARIARLNPSKDGDEIQKLLSRLRELRSRREGIREQIRQASPRLAALRYLEPLDVEGLQRSLDPGTVLLSYIVTKEKTFLFAVKRADASADASKSLVSVFPLTIGEEDLRTKVEQFRNAVQRPEDPIEGLIGRSRDLYQLLVKPAENWIASADRILISPDGPLHALPFAALVTEDRRYWIETKPLHVVVSGTLYAELKKGRPQTSSVSLVAFGDPKYPAFTRDKAETIREPETRATVRRGYALDALPATRDEVNGIAALYGQQASVYLGEAATEERAKTIPRDVRYVHFATHGLLDQRFPLNSALALTMPENPAGGQDNGLLQAWEIFEKMRIDADLVVLSACETALGEELGGEGLVGLTWAFQYAGARSIVASLWSVADESTAELMKRFYGYLKAGETKVEALRHAQLDLIGISHPFNWAAFQLIGDWK